MQSSDSCSFFCFVISDVSFDYKTIHFKDRHFKCITSPRLGGEPGHPRPLEASLKILVDFSNWPSGPLVFFSSRALNSHTCALNSPIKGDPWVAQWFGACLWPRAWSWSPGIESHVWIPAWSLLFPLPVSLPLSLSLSLCLSWINKQNLQKKACGNNSLSFNRD